MLKIKKILMGLSLAILLFMTANASDFYNRDCAQDSNECQVRVALKESEFNKYSIGREVWQVQDPKINEKIAELTASPVDYTAYNALTAHTCDVFPKNGRLIAKLELPEINQWKVRAINAFMFHVTHERETVYAWVERDDMAHKILTSRFGFQISHAPLHNLGTPYTGLVGTTDIRVPEGMVQLEATTLDIMMKCHEINGKF